VQADEASVAVGRWECDALVGAIATAREGVTEFARRRGMAPALRQDLGVAVSEAVANVVGVAVSIPASILVVEAATDGVWMSVRVAGGAPDVTAASAAPALPLVAALAYRFEAGPDREGSGISVLMEFPMTDPGGAVPGDPEPHTRAPRARARRPHDRAPLPAVPRRRG
jgi:anti-sigma regulatory factor (Ser/Thr protein kinase)